MSNYLLDNRAAAAGARFAALGALFDPSTFRHLAALGLAAGWRCWEVGAGGTSVVRWMAERVGADGHVLATDLDVSWASAAAAPNIDVRRHDLVLDEPPAAHFDLIHARLLLVHLVERDRALRTLAGALRPGGWLLIEDADPALQPQSCLEVTGPESELANKLRTGFRTLMAGRGVDLAFGRTLPRRLREVGLVEVGADAYFPIALPACRVLEIATMQMIRDSLVEGGVAGADEIDRHVANITAGKLDLAQPPMISAWGQRGHNDTSDAARSGLAVA